MLRSTIVSTVFFKELRELLRDRRSLMVMFGVPLVIYPLLFAGIGAVAKGKAQQQAQRTARVVVENPEAAPELLRRLRLADNRVDVRTDPADTGLIKSKKIDAILTIPADFEARLLSSAPPTAPPATSPTTSPAAPADALRITVDRSLSESDSTEGRLRSVIAGYERWVLEQRLAARGAPADLLAPVPRQTVDIATKDQRLGRFLGQLLPVLLLVTGMLGAFFPALNATTTERELGTLETLLVTPVNRTELLLAKGLLVLGCSVLTAFLNLVSMSLVFANMAAQSREALGTVEVNVTALVLAFISTIPALVLFSAMVMCVGMIARTYREANSFAAPVMMLPMAAMIIGMVDPPTTNALLATPIANTTVLIRDILTARFTWGNFAVAAGANLTFSVVVLSIAARLFTNEQLVNPAWEPLSLKGFRRGKAGAPRPRRVPTIDEALILVAVGMLIQFYGGPWLAKLLTDGVINVLGFIALLLTGAFLVPSVIVSVLARYDVREVFSLRAPSATAVAAAVLLGVGLVPFAMGYAHAQAQLFPSPPSESAVSLMAYMEKGFRINPWLTAVVFGIVPGICEEVLFRGAVLSSLRKRMKTHAAVWITALIFAAVHMDLPGMFPRTILGVVLGYLTVRTGSLLPAILLHAAYNSATVGIVAFYVDPSATPTTLPAAAHSAIPEPLQPLSAHGLLRLALGTLALAVAFVLLRALPSRQTPTPETR